MGVLRRESGPGWELVIWKTDESYTELASGAAPGDLESAMRFNSISRRTGHLAARAALRELLPGAVVGYDGTGAPTIVDDRRHIGFSHCDGAAAVIVSDVRCSIDIEPAGRDFSPAAPRFLSEAERGLGGGSPEDFPAVVWCAKEALYKYGRRAGTDFLRDIAITSYDPLGGTITGRLREKEGIRLAVKKAGGFIYCHIPG